MIVSQTAKFAISTQGVTVSSAATANYLFDAQGFKYARVRCVLPVAAATDSSAKWAVLQLVTGDTTSSVSTVSGGVGTTNSTASATQFVIPAHNATAAQSVIEFQVDLRGKSRYIGVTAQPPGDTSHRNILILADLYRAETMPDTTTESGVNALVKIAG